MKLNIGIKVNVLIITALVLVGGASLIMAVSSLQKESASAIEMFQTGMMEEKRNQLQDLINAAYTMAKERLDVSRDKEKIRNDYGEQVKSVVNQAISVFEAAVSGPGDVEQQKQWALGVIDKMRWGADGKNYFWVQDTDGNMIHHPIKPSLDGKLLLDLKDPDGKLFFKEMDTVAERDGAGFVDYKWPKPGHDEPVDKISYVKLFKPWGWIIGGGLYLESTEEQLKQDALTSIGSIRYGKDNSGYFFIYDSKGTCVLLPPKPERVGKNFIDLQDKKGNFLIKDMIKAGDSGPGGGFFHYYFPKPGAGETPLPKLSYVRKLAEWDWYIGTGIYTDDVDAMVAQQAASIRTGITGSILKISLVTLGILLAALAASYVIVAKGVVGPIRSIIGMLRDIARGEGDLTRRIESKSKDETRELADGFNTFIGNIQEMIRSIKSDTGVLDGSSSELAGISDEMNGTATDTSERAAGAAAASEEMSANLTSLAAAMEEASMNINMVASASEEMRATIDEIAQNAESARGITTDAVEKTREASARVNELGKAATKIFSVVETITDISSQVNLLALNATIEAARAGDAGKGFAVVANEIKDLANQTAEASIDIKNQVEGIRASTDDTTTEISTITQVVTQINDIVSTIATAVEEQSATTKEIAENVSQASLGISEVNENVAQGSAAAQEVAKDISEVTSSSDRMTRASGRVKEKAGGLSDMAGKLTDMMGKFKV